MDIEELKQNRRIERQKLVEEQKKERIQRAEIRRLSNTHRNDRSFEDEVRKVIKYTREGYTVSEIASVMNCDEDHINLLIGTCRKWFSEEQLKKFREKRKPLVNKENKKEDIKGPKSENIGVLKKSLKMIRTMAQKEDEIILAGENNVGTKKRKSFLQCLTKLFNYGSSIEENDIDLALDMIYTSPELANKGNIRFLVLNAVKTGGVESAQNIIDELRVSLGNSEYSILLSDYQNWISGLSRNPERKMYTGDDELHIK